MANLDLSWGNPYKVQDGWQREWLIPPDMRGSFFDYWKRNNLDLKGRGYGVLKKDNEWYVIETQLKKSFFSKKHKEKVVDSKEVVVLQPRKLTDESGLRPWQVNAAGQICAAIDKWGCGIDGSDVGCHAKGQLILMYDGTQKKVEEIKIDDVVMGWQGPQTVTYLHTGKEEMIKIIPTKGDSFVVNKNHILTVKITNLHKTKKSVGGYLANTIYDIKVSDYIKLPYSVKNNMKLIRGKVECWSSTFQPFSPYFMGLLLGDGGLSQKSVTFTSQDLECWNEIITEGKKFGWILGSTSQHITKRITHAKNLFSYLRKSNLLPVKCENKFIPTEYKICDVQQRLEILAGLLDSDGHYINGGYEFTVKSYQLAKDVEFVSRSLGFAAYTKQVKKTCCNNDKVGNYYKVSISGDCSIIPTRIPRKQASIRKQKKNVLVVGFTVENLGPDDFYGFSLSGDGRFLLGDFTITHNTGKTYTACGVARELKMNIFIVCPKAVMESWKRVINNHFKMTDKLVGIINYELLRTGRSDSPYASYVTRRETRRKEFVWKIPKNTLIIWDESQKLKGAKTKNSETCISALKQGYKMLFCSATNATNPLELRTVGMALKLFNNNTQYYSWLYEHGVTKGRFGLEFTGGKEHLAKLNRDIFVTRGVRLNRDTIPNFPESQIEAACYDMEEEAQKKINKIYSEMERELKKLGKKKKKGDTSELTAILRARQEIELIKVPLFIEMIEEGLESGMSVVVFVNFTETLHAIAQRLNTQCIVNGEAAYQKVRQQNIDNFQSDKERVILVNIAAGGAGLSLHDINGTYPRLALISPSYSAVNMRQATGRVWRDSAKSKSIQKIVFVAKTVEERVCESVNKKLENMDTLNDGDLQYDENNNS